MLVKLAVLKETYSLAVSPDCPSLFSFQCTKAGNEKISVPDRPERLIQHEFDRCVALVKLVLSLVVDLMSWELLL